MLRGLDLHHAYNPYEFAGGKAFFLGANSTTDPTHGGVGYPGVDGETSVMSTRRGQQTDSLLLTRW
jgi:hypothetical protein